MRSPRLAGRSGAAIHAGLFAEGSIIQQQGRDSRLEHAGQQTVSSR